MFIPGPLVLVLSFSFRVSGTPFHSTDDGALRLSESLNLVEPIIPSNASTSPLDTSAGNNLNIRCDGERYGYNPNIIDCESAKEYINPETTIWTMGERHTGLPGITVPLPYRVMGDKGFCYIQPVLIGDHTTAKASLNMIRGAAAALIMQCAIGTVAQGGIATNIGGDNNLAVILAEYQQPVSCRGTFASWRSCRGILYSMRADKSPQVFGPRSDPTVTERLPHSLLSEDGKCSANIFSAGRSDVASFYDIWQAVTAVFSVCTRHSKSGSIRGLGEHGNIFLTITTTQSLESPKNSSEVFSS